MIVSPEWLDPERVDRFLVQHIHPFDGIFASGEKANNHLDIGYEETEPWYRAQLSGAAANLIKSNVGLPDFIAPVPTGAIGWGLDIASRLPNKPEQARLKKLGKRVFTLPDIREDSETLDLLQLKRAKGIVLDDASSEGLTAEEYADFIESLGVGVIAIFNIVYRGRDLPVSKYPRYSVMFRYIPHFLDWDKNGKPLLP